MLLVILNVNQKKVFFQPIIIIDNGPLLMADTDELTEKHCTPHSKKLYFIPLFHRMSSVYILDLFRALVPFEKGMQSNVACCGGVYMCELC